MNPGKTVSLERIAVTAKISQEDALAALRSLQHKDGQFQSTLTNFQRVSSERGSSS